jgi:hypothetical protein
MQQIKVKLGQVRTEDRIDEAKILEPAPLHRRRMGHKIPMDNHDDVAEGEDMLPLSAARAIYRDG